MFTETSPQSGNDLWLLPTTGEKKPRPWLQTSFYEGEPSFSPDGHEPVWSRDGNELFYQEGTKLMTAVIAATQPDLQFKLPRLLFEGGFIPNEPTPGCFRTASRR